MYNSYEIYKESFFFSDERIFCQDTPNSLWEADPLAAAFVGSVISFAATIILTGNAAFALTTGSIAALAALIDTLINPLFREHFSENGKYGVLANTAKNIVSTTLAIAIVSSVVPLTPCYAAIGLTTLLANWILMPENGWSTNKTSIYYTL